VFGADKLDFDVLQVKAIEDLGEPGRYRSLTAMEDNVAMSPMVDPATRKSCVMCGEATHQCLGITTPVDSQSLDDMGPELAV
jgi:hypothetical protein